MRTFYSEGEPRVRTFYSEGELRVCTFYFEGELRMSPFYSEGEPRVCTFTLKECQQLELSDSVLELPQLGTTMIG